MNVKKISREIKKYKKSNSTRKKKTLVQFIRVPVIFCLKQWLITVYTENFCVTRNNTGESNFSPIELFIRYYVKFD